MNPSKILLFFSLFFLQCKNSQPKIENIDDSLAFSIEVTGCYGPCPIYKLELFASGAIIYEGEKEVDRIGQYKSKLSDETMDELFAKLEEIGFFTMKLKNNSKMLDGSSTHIYAKKGMEENKVLYYLPKKKNLEDFKLYISDLIESADWKLVSK